jgi:hypothetical protein
MTIEATVLEARRGMLPALKQLVILVFCLVASGCVTSREDDYVASVIAEAMGSQYAPEEAPASAAPPVTVSADSEGTVSVNPDTTEAPASAAPPVTVSAGAGGVVSVNPDTTVSVVVATPPPPVIPSTEAHPTTPDTTFDRVVKP